MSRMYLALALIVAGAALSPLACSSSDDEKGEPTATRPVTVGKCKYTITPRAEYTDVFQPKDSAEALAGSTTTAQPNARRIRLGIGGNVQPGDPLRPDPSTSVAVAWETDAGVNASWVQYGTSPDPSTWKADDRAFGLAYTVPVSDKNIGSVEQRLHEVHLCGLEAATTYYYRVGGGPEGQEVWSDVLSFRTTPAPGADEEVTLALHGDARGNNNNAWQILQERLYKRGDIHAQFFSGDMVDLATFHKQYVDWLDQAERDTAGKRSMLGQVLTLSTMGNHEFYNAQFFATIVQPQDPSFDRKYDELFFSTDIGPVHVVVFDDEHLALPNGDPGYTQLLTTWLKSDLGAVDRSKQPWIITIQHRGVWSSSNHGDDPDVKVARDQLAPIWDQFNVTMAVSGHDHNYERSKPLRYDQGNAKIGEGTTYVVCGGSGAEGYGNGNRDVTAKSARYGDDGTIGVYSVLKATKSKLSFSAHYLTVDGTDPEIDSLSLP